MTFEFAWDTGEWFVTNNELDDKPGVYRQTHDHIEHYFAVTPTGVREVMSFDEAMRTFVNYYGT